MPWFASIQLAAPDFRLTQPARVRRVSRTNNAVEVCGKRGSRNSAPFFHFRLTPEAQDTHPRVNRTSPASRFVALACPSGIRSATNPPSAERTLNIESAEPDPREMSDWSRSRYEIASSPKILQRIHDPELE